MIKKLLENSSLKNKLTALSAIFIIPIAFLTYLLIVQSLKEINFSAKEIDGNKYIMPLQTLLIDTIDNHQGKMSDADFVSAVGEHIATVQKMNDLYGEAMNSVEPAEDVIATGKEIVQSFTTLSPEAKNKMFDEMLGATLTLIARIGDGSNLILDPDLDSYYEMDIILLKMPELANRLSQITDVTLDNLRSGENTLERRAQYLTKKGELASTVSALAGSIESAYRGSLDGSVNKILSGPYAKYSNIIEKFSATLEEASKENADISLENNILALRESVHNQTREFWLSVADDLDRLLNLRVQGFKDTLKERLILVGIVLVLALIFSWQVCSVVRATINGLSKTMTSLASGDTSVIVPFSERHEEFGKMAKTVETFKQALVERSILEEKQDAENKAREERHVKLTETTNRFADAITRIVENLSGQIQKLNVSANNLSANAEQTARQSNAVSLATERASNNVGTVASASTELEASIREIARQVSDAAEISSAAVAKAEETNERVSRLSAAASRIGEVVNLITDIASQTNLLALNATIEAARAGDAGKGFAVVAGEVKNLASQTGKATDEISQQIESVQSETNQAVSAIGEISNIIRSINELSTSIAGAVEQQSAATGEIARNVEEASRSSMEVSDNIANVTTVAQEAGSMAKELFSAANILMNEQKILKDEVERFLAGIKTA
ncbi:MAG: methyl-accepting chemotaxis protein [Alphaproteobacteria bacterium]